MICYLENYIKKLEPPALALAVKKTADDIVKSYISNFSYREHVISLLVGEIQSGKTSHMFGVMSAAADDRFGIFILLTADNNLLQQQTFKRAQRYLSDFCVCNENDYIHFMRNDMKKPVVIVLKKNARILKQWKDNLASAGICAGNPFFIIDDEADAASPNTKVNEQKQSTINKHLSDIKKISSSSIYLQVTATPQALLLQSLRSGWKPAFMYYFQPGSGYIGGNFFFNAETPKQIVLVNNDEPSDLLHDDEFPENKLKEALITHMLTSAHIFYNGGKVCNFLIHPSVKTNEHGKFAEKIGEYLNEISLAEESTRAAFRDSYEQLKQTKKDIASFDILYDAVLTYIREEKIKILTLNSISSFDSNSQYLDGINVIVGGNSLGRGITFPQLQTIYYCRTAKRPQADTMWQHARMFGYDRDPDLLRVYIPHNLFKLFYEINETNNSIIEQIRVGNSPKIIYPTGLSPTRKNVIDRATVKNYFGGVNYFPFAPMARNIEILDEMLKPFTENVYRVSLGLIKSILELTEAHISDWDQQAFIGFINTFIAVNSLAQGRLIVRRERDISKGTGTLLSPNDRKLGDEYPDEVVLTLYKVTGNKGWAGKKLWIPNIKLPGKYVYYTGEEIG